MIRSPLIALADYKGSWPPPPFYGLSDAEILELRRRRWYVAARFGLIALILWWVSVLIPNGWPHHDPFWQRIVVQDIGSVLPLIRVVSTVSPLPGLATAVWTINILLMLSVLVPNAIRHSVFLFPRCGYSLIRLNMYVRGGAIGSGTAVRRIMVGFLMFGVAWLLLALYGDIRGYSLWLSQGVPGLALIGKSRFSPSGLLSGWAYLNASYNRYGMGHPPLILGPLIYDAQIWVFVSLNSVLVLFLRHYSSARAATAQDEVAMNALWRRRSTVR
ncbi:MAG: hypothetical protein ACYDEV_09670 [Acidiferrobacter sp.]